MRYTVGTDVPFIVLNFRIDGGIRTHRIGTGTTFIPWRDVLVSREVLVLKCAEHHKVAEQYDTKNDLKYDGFIFHGPDGRAWNNQYPRASYGQLSDEGNWDVRSYDAEPKQLYSAQDAAYYLQKILNSGLMPVEKLNKSLEKLYADTVKALNERGYAVKAALMRDNSGKIVLDGLYDVTLELVPEGATIENSVEKFT